MKKQPPNKYNNHIIDEIDCKTYNAKIRKDPLNANNKYVNYGVDDNKPEKDTNKIKKYLYYAYSAYVWKNRKSSKCQKQLQKRMLKII